MTPVLQVPKVLKKLVQIFPYKAADKKKEVLKVVEVSQGCLCTFLNCLQGSAFVRSWLGQLH